MAVERFCGLGARLWIIQVGAQVVGNAGVPRPCSSVDVFMSAAGAFGQRLCFMMSSKVDEITTSRSSVNMSNVVFNASPSTQLVYEKLELE